MSKKLCKKGNGGKKNFSNGSFVCKGCGLRSNKESKLCKPKDI